MEDRIILWLDDVRNPIYYIGPEPANTKYVWVKTYGDFVSFIKGNDMPDMICFDHDLGLGKNGFDCAKFLVEYCLNMNVDLPEYHVHSMNPIGAENIKKLFENFKKFKHDGN